MSDGAHLAEIHSAAENAAIVGWSTGNQLSSDMSFPAMWYVQPENLRSAYAEHHLQPRK